MNQKNLLIKGVKSIQELVSESNRTRTKFPPKKVKQKEGELSFKPMTSNGKFKFLHLLGIESDQITAKIRVQKRFDKMRKLLAKNMDLRQHQSNESNLQQVKIIKNLINTQEDYKNQILSKNLFSGRSDGKREFNNVIYSKTLRNGLRQKAFISETDENNLTSKQIRSETQFIVQKTRQEVYAEGDQFIENLSCQRFVSDQKSKRRMKLNILQNRNKVKQFLSPEFVEYDYLSNKKIGEPYLKDIQLYSYLHGNLDEIVNF